MIAMPTLWWTVGIAGFAAWMVVVVQQIEGKLKTLATDSPFLTDVIKNLGGGNAQFNAAFLGAMFSLLPLLLMAFAVTQVNRWTADEDDGRLELVLSTPQSRPVALLGRFAALATSTLFVGLATLVCTAVASSATGIKLDPTNLAEATLGLVPMALFVAAIGYLASGWLRAAADTGLISFLLAAWFFITFAGPELKLPDATLKLSPFYYYGTPLLHGLQLANLAVIVGVGAVALALGTLRFARKDISV
jgi:ABC-2 type transport system permease protein